jgi:hypothetical protein
VVSSAEEPIQSAFSQDGVGEQWVPILGRAIAGHDHRAGTSAFADQLVQVIRLLGGVLAHGKVVDDQQRRQQVVAQPSLPGPVGAATAQVTQQPAGLDEIDAVALPSCLMAQRFGQMGFAKLQLARTAKCAPCAADSRQQPGRAVVPAEAWG